MSKLDFGRLITAMVTPFDEEGEVDFHRAQELAVRLVDGGCDGLAICATTGESPTISYPQKLQLFKDIVNAVDGRAKVIANVGNYSTSAT
ncbi:MAG: dihydrodipicolinate synthase family protein, partial [Coriobacteriales bacterium]|nr:dihydrodipicolinate synthase family protein [Coriobacteriales bacterium]